MGAANKKDWLKINAVHSFLNIFGFWFFQFDKGNRSKSSDFGLGWCWKNFNPLPINFKRRCDLFDRSKIRFRRTPMWSWATQHHSRTWLANMRSGWLQTCKTTLDELYFKEGIGPFAMTVHFHMPFTLSYFERPFYNITVFIQLKIDRLFW